MMFKGGGILGKAEVVAVDMSRNLCARKRVWEERRFDVDTAQERHVTQFSIQLPDSGELVTCT